MIKKTYSQDLSGKNTFRMKVSCRLFIEYDSVADLLELDFENMLRPLKHIGAGSNLLFTGDFPGTILHSAIKFIEPLPGGLVSVGAGVLFDDFCAYAADKGLWGPENLSHIPGEVGAAAVQNIGAYGVEFKDIVKTVYAYDTLEEDFVHFDALECGYGYRDSMFKHEGGRYIITHVVFDLSRQEGPRLEYGHIAEAVNAKNTPITPLLVRQTIIEVRKTKLPEVSTVGSAGSFFKNPIIPREQLPEGAPYYDLPSGEVKVPAAWLIEQCGFKGRRSGNAAVWEAQPLVLVNFTGKALPEEIVALEDKIRVSVRTKFGIELNPEVEHV